MARQVELAGKPLPRAIGLDEISKRKGGNYRIIFSDLGQLRPIWVGGEGRKEEGLYKFFEYYSKTKSKRIELASMDMWKAFISSTLKNAPQTLIIYNRFHIISLLTQSG